MLGFVINVVGLTPLRTVRNCSVKTIVSHKPLINAELLMIVNRLKRDVLVEVETKSGKDMPQVIELQSCGV